MNKYELWVSETDGVSFFPADNDSAKELLAPDARLVKVFEARNWEEAQQLRYDYLGLGRYVPFEDDDSAAR